MRRDLTWMIFLSSAIVLMACYTGSAWATPAVGYVSTTMAMSPFSGIDVFNHMNPHDGTNDFWLSWQKTIGNSDIYVQSNVWDPGGDTGWHSHPGHSLIIVTAGTLTGL